MRSNLEKKITILLCTCDSYNDLWDPFFVLFKKYGGGLKSCQIVINTESKQYNYEGLDILCPNHYNTKNKVAWGKRLRDTLEKIQTEYVLFMLDDFFLKRKVADEDFERITNCVEYMEQDKSIGGFNLVPLYGADKKYEFHGFNLVKPGTEYRFNAQACIWRKEILYKSILDIESPWEWEVYGNLRNDVLIKQKIYALKEGEREPIDYGFYDYGHKEEDGTYVAKSGVMRGKWYLPSVEKLFKDNGIIVDYSIRGIYKEDWKRIAKRNKLAVKCVINPYRKIRKVFNPSFDRLIEEKNNKERDENVKRFVLPYISSSNE